MIETTLPRSSIRRAACVAVLASLVPALPAAAQAPDTAGHADVLVLGTYHFANPGKDVVKFDAADVFTAEKQAEIRAVVESLARFRPTKIAVEREPSGAVRLDSLYRAYRSGEHELVRSESQQLGFRLADRFEHSRLYPIDYGRGLPFNEMMAYAAEHDSAFVAFVEDELARMTAESNRQQRELTIGEILRLKNDPEQLAEDHGVYMRFAAVGAGDGHVGAELVSAWYERNIHIFANLQRIAESGDRVLVIFGAGHAPILRELIRYEPRMELVEAVEYLPGD